MTKLPGQLESGSIPPPSHESWLLPVTETSFDFLNLFLSVATLHNRRIGTDVIFSLYCRIFSESLQVAHHWIRINTLFLCPALLRSPNKHSEAILR